jgi:hypothetical protein
MYWFSADYARLALDSHHAGAITGEGQGPTDNSQRWSDCLIIFRVLRIDGAVAPFRLSVIVYTARLNEVPAVFPNVIELSLKLETELLAVALRGAQSTTVPNSKSS